MSQPLPPQHFFVSRRDQMVRTTHGACITFEKNKPTHVPKALHSIVLEKGILPCNDTGKELDLEKAAAAVPQEVQLLVAPETAEERGEAILKILKALVERNNSADFGASGIPKQDAVLTALGWAVDAKEIRQVWNANRQELLTGKKAD